MKLGPMSRGNNDVDTLSTMHGAMCAIYMAISVFLTYTIKSHNPSRVQDRELFRDVRGHNRGHYLICVNSFGCTV